ncbi:MAG: PEP/pyruvate-binding domain-containing protein, partial [bacterium]|nr:PEP/pyruvate-binding domain-containing protein [bacterium]
MSNKYVYNFGDGKADGDASMKELLGGKGANLAEMSNMGIPVPPGFTISTEVCNQYYETNGEYLEEVKQQVKQGVEQIEKIMDAKFGDTENPLLLSVRSGAPASMPGMMDTVLNLGLNDTTVQGIIKKSNNERFGWDSYRRFVQMYGDVVMGLKPENKEEEDPFEVIIDQVKEKKGVVNDTDLAADDLKELVKLFKDAIKQKTGKDFPTDPWEQLWGSIGAVFSSWNNPRAVKYRKLNNIPAHWGTAVNVQVMVFGNMGDDCATGVAFTRDPATGENIFYGEYLVNAQGEDVVAGTRTPQPLKASRKTEQSQQALEEIMPEVYQQLEGIQQKLEQHYKDM